MTTIKVSLRYSRLAETVMYIECLGSYAKKIGEGAFELTPYDESSFFNEDFCEMAIKNHFRNAGIPEEDMWND